ncbi:MAG TPA: NAD(P)H-hydrate dehydratase [Flavobacteriales bacterium]
MIPLLSVRQLRQVEARTIAQGVPALDLMERASAHCVDRLLGLYPASKPIVVLCGMGNNGGDGLVMAKLLQRLGRSVRVVVAPHRTQGSPEFETQLARCRSVGIDPVQWDEGQLDMPFSSDDLVVDALLGSGLDRPLAGVMRTVVAKLLEMRPEVIAIDRPTGWGVEEPAADRFCVRATHTFVLELPEYRMLLPDEAPFIGRIHVLPIGLDADAIRAEPTNYYRLEPSDVRALLPYRASQAHKGSFGHALLMAGGPGKVGAALLATQAALRSGSGLITLRTTAGNEVLVHASAPEALVSVDAGGEALSIPPELTAYSAIGIGPGIGTAEATAKLLKHLVQEVRVPLVLDADALNLLALNSTWVPFLPPGSILTPHPKEFDRLAGSSSSSVERLERAQAFAQKNRVILVLKGGPTAICSPDGRVFFNPTGNVGMAKGGSGDCLTGIITALCAQGLPPEAAALAGVYVHGSAGDLAAAALGTQGMLPTDLIAALPQAWERVRTSA